MTKWSRENTIKTTGPPRTSPRKRDVTQGGTFLF
nr:MAG TPA: hypothetical protein [Caudoviricetes sp.]